MSSGQQLACLVCDTMMKAPGRITSLDQSYYDCPVCGDYSLTGSARITLPELRKHYPKSAPVVSHQIRRMQRANERPVLNSDVCNRIFETCSLPPPEEQADNLIRWIGERSDAPGDDVRVNWDTHYAIIGAKNGDGMMFVVDELVQRELIAGVPTDKGGHVRLTFDGWQRYEELRRGSPTGHYAFMAMQFGNALLDEILNRHFRQAVQLTGFELRRLDDVPKAGLIDDRLRVEIRGCRFLIADLTHDNAGAYWEAGYAEGLGKPVIYTCEREKFGKAKTHFDTNHHLTVIWSTDDPEDAVAKLKATIRASLPEAIQQDPGT